MTRVTSPVFLICALLVITSVQSKLTMHQQHMKMHQELMKKKQQAAGTAAKQEGSAVTPSPATDAAPPNAEARAAGRGSANKNQPVTTPELNIKNVPANADRDPNKMTRSEGTSKASSARHFNQKLASKETIGAPGGTNQKTTTESSHQPKKLVETVTRGINLENTKPSKEPHLSILSAKNLASTEDLTGKQEGKPVTPDDEVIFIDGSAEDTGKIDGGRVKTYPDPDLDNEDGGPGDREGSMEGDNDDEDYSREDYVDQRQEEAEREARSSLDEELIHSLSYEDFEDALYDEKYNMLHFVSAGCEECEKFRPHFRKAAKKIWLTEQESEENVEVIFYEVTDPQLLVRFNLKVLPTVFFFRSGVPILYEGDLNADALVSWALAHFKVLSWALTDKNFDKLTAGTKDLDSTVRWLVHFCDVDAVGCDGFMATWESAASRLKDQVEFGYVDVGVEAGLVKQFNVDLDNLPAVVLLKQGQAYWCTLPLIELTTDSIVHFVKEGYKKIEEEHMPAKLSTLMTLMVKVGANTKGIGIMLVATAILLYVIYICFCRKRPLPDVGKEKGV
ncbi:uncharacterized protein LOC110987302 isoform X1 [Acanthaster planci]|uniref:Uncharacterized protein LOC110987302 isoform X1 n=1 Tax=Acanthaster planci TaxID=133434 RepID=A0A8B7ZL28_ACAPL|nr:uncharacterized protein LOC110987302 isoform X1 [Acanthaster planci]